MKIDIGGMDLFAALDIIEKTVRDGNSVATSKDIRVIELFAGVGGFRLGLEGCHNEKWNVDGAGGFKTVWANQWEPGSDRRQFAFDCYQKNFDPKGEHSETMSNEDIKIAIDRYEAGEYDIPDCDMIVGGFPCQDYSVARTLSQADGIEGKKGVLWWQIYRLAELKKPKYLLLENVDRLLKSPASQRGRDFAIILSCLNNLGYSVEWRVINAAEYGMPQRRRRVYIFAEKARTKWNLENRVLRNGIMVKAFPLKNEVAGQGSFEIGSDTVQVSDSFGKGDKVSRFMNAGAMQDGQVFTAKVTPDYNGPFKVLQDVLIPEHEVRDEFYITNDDLPKWTALKGSKRLERTSRDGHKYWYSEGGMDFDKPGKPSRTILTGEGGKTPSRFKHILELPDGRYRRLEPDELDQLQGFPRGWTDSGMTDGNRAFCMGNALCVGIPERIGQMIKPL